MKTELTTHTATWNVKDATTPKTTNVFTILNCDTMEIATQTVALNNGFHKHESPMIFETEEQAENFASSTFECWEIINSHFTHNFIEQKQNTKAEVLKVECGGMIDIDSQSLNVKIRFGKWTMDFAWTINNKTNWVHTNDTPTHLDGVEIDEDSFQIEKDANAIMFHFNFDDAKIGEEIEDRKHLVS